MPVTSRSRPTCESCRLVHPAGSQCPVHPQRSNQQSFNGVRTVSNDQPICRNFNAGRWSLGMCKYAHVCMSIPSAVGASNSAALLQATAIVNISPCTSSSTDFTCACTAVHTPLSLSVCRFKLLLRSHPDSSLASYVINSLRCSFDIGFTGNCITNQHSSSLSSAHSSLVPAMLATWLARLIHPHSHLCTALALASFQK